MNELCIWQPVVLVACTTVYVLARPTVSSIVPSRKWGGGGRRRATALQNRLYRAPPHRLTDAQRRRWLCPSALRGLPFEAGPHGFIEDAGGHFWCLLPAATNVFRRIDVAVIIAVAVIKLLYGD